MTLYGWDASHYDGTLSTAILSRAKAEGIAFFTHKIGEGTSYADPNDGTALISARNAGIEFIGGYFVPRSGVPVADQVSYLVNLADRDEPWWRTFPGWFWQVDLERWPYDSVPASVGVAFAQEVQRRTGRWTVMYASNGQYNGGLTGWAGPLWNAHYTTRTPGGFVAMYPGDAWKPVSGSFVGGWGAYSGREPTFLQYTSSAVIAGLTTCDANAFRGTTADLRTLIGAQMEQTDAVISAASRGNSVGDVLADAGNLRDQWYLGPAGSSKNPPAPGSRFDLLMQAVQKVLAQPPVIPVAISDVQVAQLAQQLQTQLGGLDVDALVLRITAGIIESHDLLTAADQPIISGAVLDALRSGTGD